MLAHGVWLDRDELELIAERGATVVANPAANMKLAVGGVLPYPEAARAGVALGLGTDGVSSNSNLDSFEEVKLLALSQKHASRRPVDAARGRGAGDRPGVCARPSSAGRRSRSGEPADFLLLRGSDPELSAGDLDADLVYAASGSVVDTTVVAGEVLMRDRRGRRAPRRSSPRSARGPAGSPAYRFPAMRTEARFPDSRPRPATTRAST